jgi:hypothetical protein
MARRELRLLAAVGALAAVAAATLILQPAGAVAASAATAADPWQAAAAELSIPVYRPAVTLGLRVAYVNPIRADPGCVNDKREQLRAVYYGAKAGRYIEVFEGYPRYCLDRPTDAPVVRHLRIAGRPATLYDLCHVRDCDGTAGAYFLEWCARGTTITVLGLDFTSAKLIRFGKSMRQVGEARARPCGGSA